MKEIQLGWFVATYRRNITKGPMELGAGVCYEPALDYVYLKVSLVVIELTVGVQWDRS